MDGLGGYLDGIGLLLDKIIEDIEEQNVDILGSSFVPEVSSNYILASKQVALDIQKVSLYLCPKDKGILRASSNIEFYNNKYGVSYNTDYAKYVHEMHGLRHESPTQSNYLEDAAYEVLRAYGTIKGKPAFTFDMELRTNGSIVCWINGISEVDFVKKIQSRYKEYNSTIDDLDGGEE